MSPHLAPILICVGSAGLASMATVAAAWCRWALVAWGTALLAVVNVALALGHAVAWAELG